MFDVTTVAQMASSANSDNEAAEALAKLILDIPTLEIRNSDSLDFREVYVSSIKDLIFAAMKMGIMRANKAGCDIQR